MSTFLIFVLVLVVVAILLVVLYFYYNNAEISLRNEAEAQEKNIAAVSDTMWKIISEKANISNEYRKAFEKIYPEIISGRYSHNDGKMMLWIQEQNPQFDTSLYQDVARAVEVQRTHFMNAQTRMLDILRQRKDLIMQLPSSWFIRDKREINYEVIQSVDNARIMETRVDDRTLAF